ncbi:ABC1 kinase family protein [Tritonibacter mobilis]|uniref:ABC1 kinase family protein n=1 Tax=Tritonibacter mobilis TaxID=379347 RepID=UPI000E0D8398|nr:AarF/ABC1/UbiB kinase family protein [Tritonibacter mobilis]
MTNQRPQRPVPVPAGRLNRFARLGATAAGIASTMAVHALGDVGRGTRPDMRRLLLTPGNMTRLADELARMRGAAMKVGQLLSMDAGEVLPPELAEIMAHLRDQAHVMPPKQLKQILIRNWGADWLRAFQRFDVQPIAAASIGQVHRALLKDGRDVAIKVQYPGIARSIDSDVSNVARLVKLSGLVPKGFDLAPLLSEARRQLHEETDYTREGAQMQRYSAFLRDSDTFVVPQFHEDWSTPDILTMSYLEGHSIEAAADAPQKTRNRITKALVDLSLRELFEFGVTQSDPNFANYRYDSVRNKIILLDFGAARDLDPRLNVDYRQLIRAGLNGDDAALRTAATKLQLLTGGGEFDDQVLAMIRTVFDAIRQNDSFSFADTTLARQMNAQGIALANAGFVPPPVPMDVLYLQRKFGGIFLLGSRLGAVVPLQTLLQDYVSSAP